MKSKKMNGNENLGMVAKAKKYCGDSKEKLRRRFALAANVVVATTTSYLLMGNVALAATPTPAPSGGSTEADGKWDALINFLTPWISKLGGAVILFGAIQFGLGFKNEDSDGMTRGMKTAIAGIIVFAVGKSADTFLA